MQPTPSMATAASAAATAALTSRRSPTRWGTTTCCWWWSCRCSWAARWWCCRGCCCCAGAAGRCTGASTGPPRKPRRPPPPTWTTAPTQPKTGRSSIPTHLCFLRAHAPRLQGGGPGGPGRGDRALPVHELHGPPGVLQRGGPVRAEPEVAGQGPPIITIHECDLGEASATPPPHAVTAPKANLAIFQPPGKALTGRSVGPSSALPGDPYSSAVGPADFEISPLASSDCGEGTRVRAPERPPPSLPPSRTEPDAGTRSAMAVGPGATSGPGEAGPGSGAGPVLQFFTRLRRHASLDGASPYFKVKKWKLDPSQRASSLDTRGSPKRHHFQRQRAASESTEQEEGDAPHMDFIQYIASAGDTVAFPPPHPFLASPTSPSPTLGRLEAAEEAGAAGGASPESPQERSGAGEQQESDGERDSGPEQAQTSYRDIWSLRASLELHAAAASDHSSSGNDRDSVRSGDSSGSGSGTAAPTFPPPSPSPPPPPRPADSEAGGPRKLLQMDSGYASIEGRGAGEDGLPSASERRSSFTSAGHTTTVGSSFEAAPASTEAPARPRSPRAWPRRAPRRDYSIDEKTDALFHEFLRHDPHFDDALPCAARHRARAHPHPHPHPHARKQWQRGRQHSDPGARAVPTAPAAPFGPDPRPPRAPLRRGDSVDCPPEGRAGEDPAVPAIPAIPVIEEEPGGGGPPGTLLDKLAAGLEDRLFPPRGAQPLTAAPAPALAVAAAPTSPDHGPA
ncbi:voltage-dependent calcium channel beta subunit-associated regulatory protein isoform X9 [Vulpes vulpes]|uniref:Voltage-dependent calcium channel beta subunit-associated regulatory protein isoform X9 n=1 Tax=Vulpes vulpes TaxID=9627 RepID=A0ABM4XJA8_VULVU